MTDTVDVMDRKMAAIDRFSGLKMLVLGDVMLDVYDFCRTEESRPIPSEKPGKRAYKAQQSIKTIGGAGNVAANLASLGAAASLIGITGNDGPCFVLQELSDALGIAHCFIRDRARPTTTKMRLYIDDEYLLRRDDESTEEVSHETALTIYNEFLRELEGADGVLLSDYDKGFFTEELVQRILQTCRERGVPVVVDFKPPNRAYFQGADIIAPNDAEAEAMQPGFKAAAQESLAGLEQAVRTLHAQVGGRNLVVTLGARGMCGFDGTDFFLAPGNRVEAVDAVGCGDTVRVGLALGYVLGLPLREAAELANDAAAVVVGKIGTATLTPDELRAFIRQKASP